MSDMPEGLTEGERRWYAGYVIGYVDEDGDEMLRGFDPDEDFDIHRDMKTVLQRLAALRTKLAEAKAEVERLKEAQTEIERKWRVGQEAVYHEGGCVYRVKIIGIGREQQMPNSESVYLVIKLRALATLRQNPHFKDMEPGEEWEASYKLNFEGAQGNVGWFLSDH